MPNEEIVSYKGFDKNWQCREFQYEVGKSYEHTGDVKACKSGFHACEYPLDMFRYYAPANSHFAIVKQSGELSRHSDDSKVASRSISISAEINIADLVKAAIEYTISRCLPIDPKSPMPATSYRGTASATGDQGAASATDNKGAASATGYQSAASATGYQGAVSATGDQGAASATGDQGAASATGYQGAASATGDKGAASATGNQGVASATGYQGAALATGDQGAASATGMASIAAAFGYEGRAQAAEGCAVILVNRGNDGSIIHIRASKVGDNGIKAGVWYSLDERGEFVEVQMEA